MMPMTHLSAIRALAQRLPLLMTTLRVMVAFILICTGVVIVSMQAGGWFASPQITYLGQSLVTQTNNLYSYDVRARQSVILLNTHRNHSPIVFAWSPDGRRLAYGARTPDDEYQYGFYVYDTGERRSTVLPLPSGRLIGAGVPSWSPDGTRLLTIDAENRDFCVITVDAGALDCRGLDNVQQAIWSPVNDEIALVTRQDRWYALSVLDMTTGERREFARLLAMGVPRWSPDGRWIVVSGNRYTSTYTNLYLVNLDDDSRSRLIERQVGDIHNISWLPDSQSLLFSHSRSTNIFQLEVEGGTIRQSAYDIQRLATLPAWSHNGQWVAYSVHLRQSSGLFVISPDDREAIISSAVSLLHFAWRP